MSTPQIVASFLVRNEDVYIERAVRNVADFCDRILIADHHSTDKTWRIIRELSEEYGKVEARRIWRASASHAMVQGYAGTRTWVFGVDGDEIYDPGGLAEFREALLAGRFDRWWAIFGNVLNCTGIDLARKEASGYLAPPSRSMTKLYNFSAISRWDGPCPERLHGGTPVFKEGFDVSLRCNLHEQVSWEESSFRCLHMGFLPRSSSDRGVEGRPNPAELRSMSYLGRFGLPGLWSRPRNPSASWKREKYMRGEPVVKDISSFFA